jgi:putative hydrolase of the HAD superfamily
VLATPQPEADIKALAAAALLDVAVLTERYWAHRPAFDLGGDPIAYWSAVTGRLVEPAEAQRLDGLDHASWSHPDPAALRLVERLLGRGTEVALLSNATAGLAAAIDELPWMQAVRRRFYSCRLRVAKPDPRAYWAVLAQLGVHPDDAFLVDDRPANVAGAERVGIPSLLFTTAQEAAVRLGIPG